MCTVCPHAISQHCAQASEALQLLQDTETDIEDPRLRLSLADPDYLRAHAGGPKPALQPGPTSAAAQAAAGALAPTSASGEVFLWH